MPNRSSRNDINLLASTIAEAATEGKNPAAVALGHLGGLKGGPARKAKLSAKRRTEIARGAAQARWRRVKRTK